MIETSVINRPITSVNKRHERFFYSAMAVAILLTVVAGFSRTFYLRPLFHPEPLMPLLIAHGIIFSSWLALFITQTTLVAAKRTRTHMRLGIAGGVIAALMIVIGTLTAIVRAKTAAIPPGFSSPLIFLTIPLGDMLVFAILISGAFYFRLRADIHKRLMLLATIGILPAAVARLPLDFILQAGPVGFFGIADLFIIPVLIWDLATRGRPHRATVLAAALIVISQPLRIVIGNTHGWIAFATWLTQWT
jgi:hypothetical protein